MIIYPLLGKPGGGRLGNSLWQIAAMIGFCQKYGCDMQIPKWYYSQYFMFPQPEYIIDPVINKTAGEISFRHTPEHWDNYKEDFINTTVELKGWFQSYKYFNDYKEKVREQLSFSHSFQAEVKEQFSDVFTRPTIAISIRRGDYVNNSNYWQLPINYYIGALYNNFSDWSNYSIVVFSDDLNYAKTHLQCLPNIYFADGLSDIGQLCLMTMCDNFILSNSTFSFWGAFLGEKEYSKIVRPNFHFDGPLLKDNDWQDYYPPHWIVYNHEDAEVNKIDLPDITFCIPVFYDHPDRKNNMQLNICMLQREFNCRILIGEQGGYEFKDTPNVDYVNFADLKEFHRTKMLNDMMKSVETPIVYNWDADVVVPPLQVLESIKLLRENKADMVYCYDGRFARVQRETWFEALEKSLDVGIMGGVMFKGMRPFDAPSCGGAMAWLKEKFIEGGMENEKMISYAPEDVERLERFTRLGYRVKRIKGVLYHMDHHISINSSEKNPHFKENWAELYRMRELNDNQLRTYIKTWSWL